MRNKNQSPFQDKVVIIFLLSLLISVSISSCSCSNGPSEFDPELFVSLYCSSAEITIPPRECKALGMLYYSTNGPNWQNNGGWFEDENLCNWFGVDCENGYVSSILMTDNNLEGTLPEELKDLTALQSLILSENALSGQIPFAALGNMPYLNTVHLSDNNFSGTLCGIGSLGDIQVLGLNSNQLIGIIPGEVGLLTDLRFLNLSRNKLTGSIPKEIGDLLALSTLDLSRNRLTGNIPVELSHLVNLTHLNLYINSLSDVIPSELGNLTQLQTLILTENYLSGKIPETLGNLVNIEWIMLNNNSLVGRIPEELGSLSNLQTLHLDHNQLTGNIPVSLMSLPELLYFTAAEGNLLCRPGDQAFQQWLESADPEIDIPVCGFECGLQDSIPVKECDALQTLYASTNGDSWTTKTGWLESNNPCTWYGVGCNPPGHVTSLELHGNNLLGTIPPEIGDLSLLTRLRLGDNQLAGPLPLQLQSLAVLVHLEYDDTAVCEPDALEFRAWLFRPTLDREGTEVTCDFYCSLQESIPTRECNALRSLYRSTYGWDLDTLWLDHRDPCEWYGVECRGGHVTRISLPDNNISGNIPPNIGDLNSLEILDLRFNQLEQGIPSELTNLGNLYTLDLSNNNLPRSIPAELGGMCNLVSIALNNNQISGEIPPELSSLPNLLSLKMNSNELSGSIPPELGRITSLHYLDLSSNQLTGDIPSELGNLVNLFALKLNNNQLVGNLPFSLGKLSDLGHLYLNNNELEGNIPDKLGDLEELEGLQLNNNQFSGAIPTSLTNLTSLNQFKFQETDLCVPSDSTFQEWLNNISIVNSTDVNCNTRVGSDMVVSPADDSDPATSPVEITFNKVTREGNTSLSTTNTETSPPSGFRIGNPPTYYLVETNASFSQGFSICINYSGVEYNLVEDLAIEQYQLMSGSSQGSWRELDSEIDLNTGEVCAEGTYLFTFE